MQTLSTIKALLAAQGMHPRKRFGQNFLHDQNKVREILAAAELSPGQLVLEVGPGTGVLTEAMLAAGVRVLAVEIDRDLCAVLRERIGPDGASFRLLNEDVLAGKHALAEQLAAALQDEPFTLVANLPYNVASPLLAVLCADYPKMQAAIVMIQKEVAERIIAKPGGKDFGPLTVTLQAMCEVRWITTLSKHCFWPEPQIESAVVRLDRRAAPLTDNPAALAHFLQTLFSKRRKQIGAILGRDTPWPNGIDPTMRPEQLTVQQIVQLSCVKA